ncbi:hypothetical protein VTK73DRAFT_2647 [Phialemonium thermophilum]|uniref:Amidase domain-containing protein n=1 Tax=Phialemonium thermophilum TaxID=223376 RepID=A0ABR3X458_9PEZI
MSTSLDGLELLLRSLLSTEPWLRDPAVVPIPFRKDVVDAFISRADKDGTAVAATTSKRPLKFGVFWSDGVVQPHPPVTRGLKMVVEALRKAGHKIVDWNPPDHDKGIKIHHWFTVADGGDDVHNNLALSGEPLLPILAYKYAVRKQPHELLEYQKYTVEGLEYELAYSDYWNSTAADDGQIVDAVIMPAAPHAAVIPGKYYHNRKMLIRSPLPVVLFDA